MQLQMYLKSSKLSLKLLLVSQAREELLIGSRRSSIATLRGPELGLLHV